MISVFMYICAVYGQFVLLIIYSVLYHTIVKFIKCRFSTIKSIRIHTYCVHYVQDVSSIFYSKTTMNIGQDFLDFQYGCPTRDYLRLLSGFRAPQIRNQYFPGISKALIFLSKPVPTPQQNIGKLFPYMFFPW